MAGLPPSSPTNALAHLADLSKKAQTHLSKHEFQKAQPLFQRCLQLSEGADGAGNPPSAETGVLLYNLGYTHYMLDEDANAVEILRRALAAVSNADHITRCNVSRYLCDALYNCDNYVDAEAQCQATLKLLEEASDAGALLSSSRDFSELRADVLYMLGRVHSSRSHPFEALRVLEDALSLFEALGESGRAADVLGCISFAYDKQGLHDKALAAAQRAVSIDGGTSFSFSCIGDALFGLHRYEEALATYRKALACIPRKTRRSLQVADIHLTIGITLHYLGRNADALTSLRLSRDIREELQDTSIGFASTLLETGLVLAHDHRQSEAPPLVERALEFYRRCFPADHPRIAYCLEKLSELRLSLGDLDAAIRAAAEAASVSRRSQTQCAAAGCPRQMKADGSSLEMCAGCRRTHYCSIECQRADWKAVHKAECKSLQKERKR